MTGTLLTEAEIVTLLADHPAWKRDGDGLRRAVEFADFGSAFGFMTRVALVSEKLFHHPDWSNAYNRVDIRITDHEVGGISTNDRDWIDHVDQLL